MTQPTIEQMIEWLNKRDAMPLCSHGEEFNEAIKNRGMLKAIRAALTAQGLPDDGNRLPLEEVPEGWRLRYGCALNTKNDKWLAILTLNSGPVEVDGLGATPAEALRAVIKAAKDGAG